MTAFDVERYSATIDPVSCEAMDGHAANENEDIEALVGSIVQVGQLHPVQVLEYDDGRRVVAAGYRRWIACKRLGLPLRVDVWFCNSGDTDLESFGRALANAENQQRR